MGFFISNQIMRRFEFVAKFVFIFLLLSEPCIIYGQDLVSPEQIQFVRKGVRRLIFDENQSIPLAGLYPEEIIGMETMFPVNYYSKNRPEINISEGKLSIRSTQATEASVWFGGFNPFATYIIDLYSINGDGEVGFEFSDVNRKNQFILTTCFDGDLLTAANLKITKDSEIVFNESVRVNSLSTQKLQGKITLQMLGSGFTLFLQNKGIPEVIGQADFNKYLDLRRKDFINSFQSNLFVHLNNGSVTVNKVQSVLSTGVGLADIRVITYENGEPILDGDRLWYTMSIRGRALPHHIQGVFSMNPTVFDIRLEGIIVFDRNDGILRNEIASHIFYDRQNKIWRGLTTGFSAYANIEKEKKQLLTIESEHDPRFGFSVMQASPFGVVGDIEDPHILYDDEVDKWRILTCQNIDGYKAVVLESENWNKGYKKIAGPVVHNSTGTSIMKIGEKRYCFSGSSERAIFIYSYPDLQEVGKLKIELPPWSENTGTRVWPNVVQLPDGYPHKYFALMMDRLNFPGLQGPNWSYGAIYLYHGYETGK